MAELEICHLGSGIRLSGKAQILYVCAKIEKKKVLFCKHHHNNRLKTGDRKGIKVFTLYHPHPGLNL